MKFQSFSKCIVFAVLVLSKSFIFAQNPTIDVEKYVFSIQINDANDSIYGEAAIKFKNLAHKQEMAFDLVSRQQNGTGMKVDSVKRGSKNLQFRQTAQKLFITNTGEDSLRVFYHGIPADGLIISENKYGDRTFFGDNWPNRAHQWLPVIDHPSDKAYVDFKVTAPSHYQVVANGSLLETTNIDSLQTLHYYSSSVPLPTKVMVFGAAEFAVQNLPEITTIPVSTWVYPENKKAGFYDYEQAEKIVHYFIENIGPYPFSKLANVQSTTRYGGMENASNIFYFENSVTGERTSEFLLAHEIAHQWFGDSASEKDWSQLWLSEGFATYFTDLYAESAYGKEKFKDKLKEERQKVINFSKNDKGTVIHKNTENLMYLLNPNSYEKGAWFLHMLRQKVGTDVFWQSIRRYYEKFKLSNAETSDLRGVFEETSGQDLQAFFNQWLRQYGQPVLKSSWKFGNGNFTFILEQQQKNNFEFPLKIRINYTDGSSEIKSLHVTKKEQKFQFKINSKPASVTLDPEVELLFENATMEN